MCALVGFLTADPDPDAAAQVQRMAAAVAHRGPDDEGHWVDLDRGIALAHRRLSVVDLSAAGHQPMVSSCGRYVLVFNGEIYNHLTIRAAFAHHAWRGHSDTETLLACFSRDGIDASLPRLVGMFALAVWDRQHAALTLVRDRLGEKPLYYGWQGTGAAAAFLFGSELKALKTFPAFKADLDRDALCLMLRHDSVPAPYSIYRGVHKLLPGCTLTVSLRRPVPAIQPYWSAIDLARRGATADRFAGTPEQAVGQLDALLRDAVQQQMVADVPLGAFLSGGVDSSTVVAMMQAQSPRPVRSFTIGFHDQAFDEAAHARAVAKHLGTNHTELSVSHQEAMAVIPRLPALFDEPFGDSSQIPTFLVSQLASQQVTVSLSGDGGDELFCGYGRYQATARRWRQLSALPGWLRPGLVTTLNALPAGLLDDERRRRASALLACKSLEAVYRTVLSHWQDPAALVTGGTEPPTALAGRVPDLRGLGSLQHMMALDLITYLPDDILQKLDRAAMGVSLETRLPLLDHRVVEFALRLPIDLKLRQGQSKWVLRQVLQRYLPARLVDRAKMGFSVPIGRWLRGPLRAWAESLIDEKGLRREGVLDAAMVRTLWQEHLRGLPNRQHHLWNVLMFQAWLRENNAAS